VIYFRQHAPLCARRRRGDGSPDGHTCEPNLDWAIADRRRASPPSRAGRKTEGTRSSRKLPELGKRHPVRDARPGRFGDQPPHRSRCVRMVDTPAPAKGTPVMQGPDNSRVLLSREGRDASRCAVRSHLAVGASATRARADLGPAAGGSPHWLMKQPDLKKEEALRSRRHGADLEKAAANEHGGRSRAGTVTKTEGQTRTLTPTRRSRRVEGLTTAKRARPVARADGNAARNGNVCPATPRDLAEGTSSTRVLAPWPMRPAATRAPQSPTRRQHEASACLAGVRPTLQGRRLGSKMARTPAWCVNRAGCRARRPSRAVAADRELAATGGAKGR